MKKVFKYILLGLVVVTVSSSCKKFLDINTNPNSFTSATPAQILPQAIVAFAANSYSFNINMADFNGNRANAGGFGGFGSVVTYDFGTGDYAGLWSSSYDNANDFQYVITNTSNDPKNAYSTSIARIMKSMAFERLVDQFNDVPYSDALKGSASLQPKYDKAEDIYKACIADIDLAITDITAAQASSETNKVAASVDPMFKGDMNLWKQLANTVKLRMLIKMANVPALQSYATAGFASMDTGLGFTTTDAIVNPTYEKTTKPSPIYNSIGFTTSGANTTTSRIPTKWIFSFLKGPKLTDPGRGGVIYRGFSVSGANATPINQMGDESATVPKALSAGSSWFTGDKNTASVSGLVKGPTMGTPVVLATETYFMLAEAYLRGYLTGNVETAFNNGITQSFNYLYKDASNTVPATKNVAADVATYKTNNTLSPLVNFSLATTTDMKLEAIITQKYIALNMIANDVAFNDFRRTGYPKIVEGSAVATETFASRQSVSTHADRLPTRVLYPQEEYNLNPANAPSGINKFSSLIFWDLN